MGPLERVEKGNNQWKTLKENLTNGKAGKTYNIHVQTFNNPPWLLRRLTAASPELAGTLNSFLL